MKDTLDWHIGKSAHGYERLDTAPLKACFYWKHDGILVESAEYSLDELERFIAELGAKAQFRDQYEKARTDLIKSLKAKRDSQ